VKNLLVLLTLALAFTLAFALPLVLGLGGGTLLGTGHGGLGLAGLLAVLALLIDVHVEDVLLETGGLEVNLELTTTEGDLDPLLAEEDLGVPLGGGLGVLEGLAADDVARHLGELFLGGTGGLEALANDAHDLLTKAADLGALAALVHLRLTLVGAGDGGLLLLTATRGGAATGLRGGAVVVTTLLLARGRLPVGPHAGGLEARDEVLGLGGIAGPKELVERLLVLGGRIPGLTGQVVPTVKRELQLVQVTENLTKALILTGPVVEGTAEGLESTTQGLLVHLQDARGEPLGQTGGHDLTRIDLLEVDQLRLEQRPPEGGAVALIERLAGLLLQILQELTHETLLIQVREVGTILLRSDTIEGTDQPGETTEEALVPLHALNQDLLVTRELLRQPQEDQAERHQITNGLLGPTGQKNLGEKITEAIRPKVDLLDHNLIAGPIEHDDLLLGLLLHLRGLALAELDGLGLLGLGLAEEVVEEALGLLLLLLLHHDLVDVVQEAKGVLEEVVRDALGAWTGERSGRVHLTANRDDDGLPLLVQEVLLDEGLGALAQLLQLELLGDGLGLGLDLLELLMSDEGIVDLLDEGRTLLEGTGDHLHDHLDILLTRRGDALVDDLTGHRLDRLLPELRDDLLEGNVLDDGEGGGGDDGGLLGVLGGHVRLLLRLFSLGKMLPQRAAITLDFKVFFLFRLDA